MAKGKKKVPGLNTSSTADISFMLLIFFLVTTSMDTDMGLSRRLPQPPENEEVKQEMKIKDRNLMEVRINSAGELYIKDGRGAGLCPEFNDNPEVLRDRAKEFIKNDAGSPLLPELLPTDIGGDIGVKYVTADHVISVQTDRGTPYEKYFIVQNELVAAYNELRDEISKQLYHRAFLDLDADHRDMIRKIYPQKISEAEPKNYGGDK